LNVVLIETGRMLERLVVHNVELAVQPAPSPQYVKADPGQLGQVILNLAVNARDAMPEGGKLQIETKSVTLAVPLAAVHGAIPPGAYTVLTVRDSGTGMSHEVQNHIFEPFYTTKKPGKGTGLGLAIVYGVVKQTGGWITVCSEPNRGTSFEIYFPRAERGTEGVPKPKAALPTGAPGTETILLVEDQQGIRELVYEFLKNRGYAVLCAADGHEALKIANEQSIAIDLLVTDVVMPNMGGRELAHRLTHLRPSLKVLFMSGNPDQASLSGGSGDATADVLQKPFPLDTLLHKVRSVLDR